MENPLANCNLKTGFYPEMSLKVVAQLGVLSDPLVA